MKDYPMFIPISMYCNSLINWISIIVISNNDINKVINNDIILSVSISKYQLILLW